MTFGYSLSRCQSRSVHPELGTGEDRRGSSHGGYAATKLCWSLWQGGRMLAVSGRRKCYFMGKLGVYGFH